MAPVSRRVQELRSSIESERKGGTRKLAGADLPLTLALGDHERPSGEEDCDAGAEDRKNE